MSNLVDLQTINDIDECPSILDVLGFLKFPNIKPLSLSEDNISSQIDQELGSLSSQQQDTTITDLSSTAEPPTPDTSTFTLSDESKKPELQDETTVPSTFSLIGRGYKSKSSKRSTKKRSPSKKSSTKRRSTKRRSTKKGSTKRRPTKKSSTKRRPSSTKKGSTKRRPSSTKKGSSKRRSTKKGSSKKRSTKRRSTKRRSTKKGSTKRRSTKRPSKR